jgi:hypothetical protein
MAKIIAVVLAISLGMFQIPGAQALGAMNHHAAVTDDTVMSADHAHSDDHVDHHQAASLDCEDGTALAAPDGGCLDPETASHDASPDVCCDMACHAFTMVLPAVVGQSAPFVRLTTVLDDQQVEGGLSARLERPPRTV